MTEALAHHRCPICGGPNSCAAAAAGTTDVACWCLQEQFSAELLALVPTELKRVACICRSCAEAASRWPTSGSTSDKKMIELYYFPGNASFTPHVLLRELDVAFELRLVDRAGGEHKQAAYLGLNPNGVIPVLIDGELGLYETAAICLHLADTHPASRLMPPLGTAERAQAYKWLIWSTNTLQATLMHYFYPERMVDAGNSEGALQVKAHAEARVGELLSQIDQELARHRSDWFLGEQFSVLDPYLFMLCRWTRGFSSRPAREYQHIGPYLARVLERPAVQRTLAAEGLGEPWY